MLIDCGATNCVIHIIHKNGNVEQFKLEGYSPISQSLDELPILRNQEGITDIYFFGTAFEKSLWARAQKIYNEVYPTASVTFSNDLEAAALATLGNKQGYIHIMGTGSAVAFWDGEKIIREKRNLGYLFEDYASGYDIAREVIRAWNNKEFDENEIKNLASITSLENIVKEVYNSENPKSKMSGYSRLINQLNKKSKEKIFNSRLEQYYIKNIDNLELNLPHYFVGSMAYIMSENIRNMSKNRNLHVGEIVKDTHKGLVSYFKNKIIQKHV